MSSTPNDDSALDLVAGSALLRRLHNHRAMMAPHQKNRTTGRLLLESITEIERLSRYCGALEDQLDESGLKAAQRSAGFDTPNTPVCHAETKPQPKQRTP